MQVPTAILRVLLVFVAAPALAQEPASSDSGQAAPPPAPAPMLATPAPSAAPVAFTPTPAQQRYLEGLRTAGRGIAQLKDGIGRLTRSQSARDTVQVRQAGRRLGGLCGTARSFIVSGRTQMAPTAFEPPTRKTALLLSAQLDSLTAYAPTCQRTAGKTPVPVATELLGRLRGYEAALVNFRSAIGLPTR